MAGAPGFGAATPLLAESLRVYFRNLPFIAVVTLAAAGPAKFLAQGLLHTAGYPPDGLAAWLAMDLTDLLFGALAAPAIIYGVRERETGAAEALRRAVRVWPRLAWNNFKVEITVTLYGALLVVPGVIAFIRLFVVPPVVVLEPAEPFPMERSRHLTAGRRGKIFVVLLPLLLMELLAYVVLFGALEPAGLSWFTLAAADCVLAVASQWALIASLLVYLRLSPAIGKGEPDQRARTHRKKQAGGA